MNVDKITDRPIAYNNIDGVGELGMGFFFFACALLNGLQTNAPPHTFWHRMDVFCVYWGALSAVLHFGPKAIKSRLTYPRTGFVEYRTRNLRWSMLLGALVSVGFIAIAWVLRILHLNLAKPAPLLFGLFLGCGYGYGVARRMEPWKWVVAAAIATGPMLLSSSRDWWLSSLLFCGALFTISGAITLVMYVRNTRPTKLSGVTE